MRLLVDTHAFLWWRLDDPSLGTARGLIADPGNEILVSVVVAWEIVVKRALGRLEFTGDLADAISEEGFGVLPVELRHVDVLATLPPIHADPFDRLLLAQARADGLTLVTADRTMLRYPGVPLLAIA